jgi:CHAD domain-containing protein
MARPKRLQRQFSRALAATGRDALAEARRALTDPKLSEAELVHAVRKAFKRWRALLRLLGTPLGGEADRMRAEARELMHKLAPARDAQAATDAVRDLRKAKTIPAEELTALRERMTVIRDTAGRDDVTPALRHSISQYLDYCSLALKRWPLDDIPFETFADALTSGYRRARRRVPDDWETATPEALHALRRRVVEYQNQMTVFERLGAGFSDVASRTQRLRNKLGACQDLRMLEHFVAVRSSLAPWQPRLPDAIATRRAAHLKNAERAARHVFARKPGSFGRDLAVWAESVPAQT